MHAPLVFMFFVECNNIWCARQFIYIYHRWLTYGDHVSYSLGLKKASGTNDKSAEILLQVSNFIKDVPISMLSDDNFSKVINTLC